MKLLKLELKKEQNNADFYNLHGYAYRKNKNFSLSIKNYKRALVLEPKQIGVHNYIGKAFLRISNLDKSKMYLEELKEMCGINYNEYIRLKKK